MFKLSCIVCKATSPINFDIGHITTWKCQLNPYMSVITPKACFLCVIEGNETPPVLVEYALDDT